MPDETTNNGDRPEPVAGYEQLLAAAADHARAFVRALETRPVRPDADRGGLREALDGPLPDQPGDPMAVLDALVAGAEPGLLRSQSPRFYGFVIGGTHPVALAADWLTSAWDQNAGMASVSPAAAVAERVAAGWLLDLLGLPSNSSVGVVTGGQMATWTGLAAARHRLLADAGWDVERAGLHHAPRIRVLVGEERHGTVDRALRFLGIGTDAIVPVRVDDQGRMDPHHLAQQLASPAAPTLVVAEAGNVNSGAVDPLRDVVAAAHAHDAWVHVDGAFGLWAAASERRRHLTDGVAGADSWSVDAHKWLNVPFDCGIAITRHPAAHRAALGATAAYLDLDDDAHHDAINWNPEHSRRARGFALWATLRTLGRRGVADLVDRLCDRAVRFAQLLGRLDGAEVLNQVVLNQVLVRFTGRAGDEHEADVLTRDVIARVQQDGTCWMSGTTWQGRAAMRISVTNWATSEDDVDRSAAAVVRCLDAARVARAGFAR